MRISLGLFLYIVIGMIVAAQHGSFTHLQAVSGIVSAVLTVLLWPLVLLGVHASI